MKVILILDNKRQCGSCTKCCEGWLPGEVNGYKFWPGRPCHYQGDGKCEIYTTRPDDPCKSYQCAWLADETIPEWLKPSKSNVILSYGSIAGEQYVDASETGAKMDSSVLSWLLLNYINGKYKNVSYRINGAVHRVGTPNFMNAFNR